MYIENQICDVNPKRSDYRILKYNVALNVHIEKRMKV